MIVQLETAESSAGSGGAASLGVAGWLSLAAAPTLAIMALTAFADSADMICSAAQGAFALNGMAMMYLLMGAFHLPPWLRLISSRRSSAGRC